MKDLKTRFNEFKNDPHVQGIAIGAVVGCATTLVTLKLTHANFTDPETTLHIPDSIVDSIVETGLPVLLNRRDGVQLCIGPS